MLIELEGVTKLYGAHKALDGITATVRPGVIGLLGPNGAGKSTLIKALLGLVSLSSGRARVLGHDVRSDPRGVRQECGYMPEDDCVLPGLTGVESVAFVGELARLPPLAALRRAHEILDYVGIAEERYREVQSYSTGMRQKMRLGQALIHSPRLVFLDEPTSGLDPKGRKRMLKLVRSLWAEKEISVVLSTHILHDVEACCDSVLILGRGKLLVYDDLQTLRRPVDDSVVVEVDGDREAFLAALEALYGRVERLGPTGARVVGAPEKLSADLLRCADETGVALRRVQRAQNSLEDIFLKAVKGDGADAHL